MSLPALECWRCKSISATCFVAGCRQILLLPFGPLSFDVHGDIMRPIFMICFLGLCAFAGGAATGIPLRTNGTAAAQDRNKISQADSFSNPALQLQNLFEGVAEKVAPGVVAVESSYTARVQNPGSSKNKIVEESGSGFIVQFPFRSGYFVLTNNHVIAFARPKQITIYLGNGRILQPTRVWSDPETDVALLALDPKVGQLPTVEFGDSDRARVGQWVLAAGSPFGLNQTVTHGILSARERGEVSLGSTIRIKDFLQTDAAINPGSSGGPLVDLKGRVIGINTAIASHSGTSSGVAFSIPINLVKRVSRQLLTKGEVSRGYLGMQLARTFEAKQALRLGLNNVQGALVERVYPKTPAEQSGLKADDVVLRVENVTIRNENHLINLISKLPAGQRIRLSIWRDRRMMELSAIVGDWNKAQNRFQVR